jgi:hypothetical protein
LVLFAESQAVATNKLPALEPYCKAIQADRIQAEQRADDVAGDSGMGLAPRVVGSAYTKNVSGTSVTTLFGIDSNRDVLVRQGGLGGVPSPNGGLLTTIGSGLGFNTSDLVGFDISGTSGVAFASLTPATGGPSQLFTINLTTGTGSLS